jgi:hypothetical protein
MHADVGVAVAHLLEAETATGCHPPLLVHTDTVPHNEDPCHRVALYLVQVSFGS